MPELPDLVLLDVKMPEMDGYETFSHMKEDEELSSVPVIFLTADKADESEIKGRKMGAADYIKKPYTPSELKITVASALDYLKLSEDNENLIDDLRKCNNQWHY